MLFIQSKRRRSLRHKDILFCAENYIHTVTNKNTNKDILHPLSECTSNQGILNPSIAR